MRVSSRGTFLTQLRDARATFVAQLRQALANPDPDLGLAEAQRLMATADRDLFTFPVDVHAGPRIALDRPNDVADVAVEDNGDNLSFLIEGEARVVLWFADDSDPTLTIHNDEEHGGEALLAIKLGPVHFDRPPDPSYVNGLDVYNGIAYIAAPEAG